MARFDRTRARVALSIASAIGVALLAACNGILGIDGFHEGPPLAVDGGGNDATVPDATTSDGGVDGSSDATIDVTVVTLPEGSAPVSFARWKMPDPTPGAANAPSYAATDSGVLDQVTGLVWLTGKPLIAADGTFESAKAACDGATPAGTWRLPTRIELISLLEPVTDAGVQHSAPLIDTTYFTGNQSAPVWTSSPHLPVTDPPAFWAVDFGSTSSGPLTTTDVATVTLVRCVKGTGG
jgi:hypothetical protein